MCIWSSESQLHCGTCQKKCVWQDKGLNCPFLLRSHETLSAVLHSALRPPEEEHRSVRVGPERRYEYYQKAGAPLLWREAEIASFIIVLLWYFCFYCASSIYFNNNNNKTVEKIFLTGILKIQQWVSLKLPYDHKHQWSFWDAVVDAMVEISQCLLLFFLLFFYFFFKALWSGMNNLLLCGCWRVDAFSHSGSRKSKEDNVLII